MSETKWSPEPWTLEGATVYRLTDDGRQNRFWCQIQSPKRISEGEASDAETQANALRIVACVNACAGIPTEALESGAVGELIDAARRGARGHCASQHYTTAGRCWACDAEAALRALGRLK